MLWKRTSRFNGFRDQRRDAQIDLQRCETVFQAASEAIAAGLERRIDELCAWVSEPTGPEDMSDGARDTWVETELADSERHLTYGIRRLNNIEATGSEYCGIQGTVKSERMRSLQAICADG